MTTTTQPTPKQFLLGRVLATPGVLELLPAVAGELAISGDRAQGPENR